MTAAFVGSRSVASRPGALGSGALECGASEYGALESVAASRGTSAAGGSAEQSRDVFVSGRQAAVRPIRSIRKAAPSGRPVRSVRTLRLTRRGRILGLLLVAAVVYGAFGLGRASAAQHVGVSSARDVVVQPGDSLWSIAVKAMPSQDPRDAVAKLKSLNQLTSAQLDVGERLLVR